MFAEDVGLLPKVNNEGAFTGLLKTLKNTPEQFVPLVAELWKAMDEGQFSVAIRAQLPRFNGKLFKKPEVLPLDRSQIELLLEAAKADWSEVEPAIFGTLLESALDPLERHDLGAHYTPRAYVDRLVLPTVIEPLRADWHDTQTAALLLANEGKLKDAADLVRAWHHKLCTTRVLDPACGSGNFLYVTLEHMKRLEGEVLDTLAQLGDTQQRLEVEGLTVDPHQFLGLEINPRAAAIAEMVLWIGYLQWHFRTQGSGLPPSPILRDFKNIECRDAVLACDAIDFATDASGQPLTRWDGRTTKPHPVTGELVPDETAQIPRERYTKPAPRRMAASRLHRRQPALHRRQLPCARLPRRRLHRSPARRLAGRPRIRRFRHVLVAPRRRPDAPRRSPALRLHHHQQPHANLQPPRPRTPPQRPAAARPRLGHPRPPVGRRRQRRRRAHRDDRRPARRRTGNAANRR